MIILKVAVEILIVSAAVVLAMAAAVRIYTGPRPEDNEF